MGVCCFAMAVRDHGGRTIAALSISFPTVRFIDAQGEKARALLQEAVVGVSAILGFHIQQQPQRQQWVSRAMKNGHGQFALLPSILNKQSLGTLLVRLFF